MVSKKVVISLLAGISLLTPGFSMAPPINGSDKAQTPPAITIDKAATAAAAGFLPKGARFIRPNEPKGSQAIQAIDLNGDGRSDIIAAYKTVEADGSEGPAGLLALENTKTGYKKLVDYTSEGYSVDFIKTAPITGSGKNDLLVGFKIGASAGDLVDIFSWKNNGLEKLDSFYSNKLEILDMPNEKGATDGIYELANWQHDTAEAYNISVTRWDGTHFVPATDVYPYYFKKVIPYYQQKVKEMPGAAFYWYHLADAQLNAGKSADAIVSANKGIEILKQNPDYYPEVEQFNKLIEAANAK